MKKSIVSKTPRNQRKTRAHRDPVPNFSARVQGLEGKGSLKGSRTA